jgi:hypothetical protein
MQFIVTPILVNGEKKCCDAVTHLTSPVVVGDASVLGDRTWQLYLSTPTGDYPENPCAGSDGTSDGEIFYGTSCATGIELNISGEVELYYPNYDTIEVFLNDVSVFQTGSTGTLYETLGICGDEYDSAWQKESRFYNIKIPMTPSPCGNIIKISGGTIDDVANNYVGWSGDIRSI